ncbi:1-acyl-sn-glycerol-3-phosphate acyltransferase [Phragmitibacter flavus]|uniref:1-acyl-sn-glycerol-3-phosphate acyltransferase n=1 Tax=Phragmitibacter flavus TaxID=2576071 RepID=A0A5R8KGN2_9BACT|nr:lysophospholipid acyltransferase family protein [Phragmitibacter flavus]TLD71391.1 1-acyl-sn-glycerol-3-phosphate acyltransferase [Phragmitibacter flavus]
MLRPTAVFLTKLITGANAQWVNCPKDRDCLRIYFANHGSHLDFATLWAALPAFARDKTRPVAARDYWGKNAFTRTIAIGMFNSLLINRETITRKDNPIEQMAAAMREGNSLIIFPEGTRSMDGQMAEFKAGLYHLANKVPEAEVVPVYLENLNRILPKGHLLPIPLLSRVVFGEPMRLQEGERKTDFLLRCRHALESLASPT